MRQCSSGETETALALVPAAWRPVFAWLHHWAYRRGSEHAPLCHGRFAALVRPCLPLEGTIVEAGCGCGDKLWALRQLAPRARLVGIERDAWAAGWARRLCPWATIVEADVAMTDLSWASWVYCWGPCRGGGPIFVRGAEWRNHSLSSIERCSAS